MSSAIYNLTVEIVRFTDESFPGWVAAEFVDADGRRHIFVDKVPTFTSEGRLDASSDYPQPGSVACTVLNQSRDANGRESVRISTRKPFWIETTEGLSEFVVFAHQITPVTQEATENKF